jgi:hypothetical protein
MVEKKIMGVMEEVLFVDKLRRMCTRGTHESISSYSFKFGGYICDHQ